MHEKVPISEIAGAVGNSESKALLFGAMKPGVDYSTSPLYREFMDMQAKPQVWIPAKAMPQNYCPTFEAAGLVVEANAGFNNAKTHRVSELGLQIGKPVVGHLLDISAKTEVPLLAFFGPSATQARSGNIQAAGRISFMRMLIEGEGKPHSIAEAAESLNSTIGSAASAIESIEALGLVKKTSSGRGKPTVEYSVLPGFADLELRSEGTMPLLHEVYDVLQKHFKDNPEVPINNHDIAAKLLKQGATNMPESRLIQRVGKFTNYFATKRKVLIKKRDNPIAKGTRASVQATDDQLELMSMVVAVVDNMAAPSDNYVKDGAQKLDSIMADKQLVNKLLFKAKESSPGLKATDDVFIKNRESVTDLLTTATRPLTAREVRDALVKRGVNLSRESVSLHVKQLAESGQAVAEGSTSGRTYVIAKNTQSI